MISLPSQSKIKLSVEAINLPILSASRRQHSLAAIFARSASLSRSYSTANGRLPPKAKMAGGEGWKKKIAKKLEARNRSEWHCFKELLDARKFLRLHFSKRELWEARSDIICRRQVHWRVI